MRGDKQCTCFSFCLAKPQTIFDLGTYKKICSTQSKRKVLSFFSSLFESDSLLLRENIGSIVLTLIPISFSCSFCRQKGQSIPRQIKFLGRRMGHGRTLRVTDKYFHISAQLRKVCISLRGGNTLNVYRRKINILGENGVTLGEICNFRLKL